MRPAELLQRFPWTLAAAAAALVAISWVGIARADALAAPQSGLLARQWLWTAAAVLAAVGSASAVSYRVLCRHSYAIYGLSLVLLLAVFAFPSVNGAHRWIRIGPIGFQPSELAKVAMVLALARWLMYRDDQRRLTGLLVPLLLASAPALLVLKEPDLGTALVFLPVLAAMLFGAGARLRDLAVLATLGVLLLPAFWSQMSREQRSRVTALLSPARADQRPTADTYHLHQARQMIALGGWLGSAGGDGAVDDRLTPRVPEPHTDSIFALLCERLGLIGAGGVLACYGLMVARGLAIAQATREPFGRLLALGLSTLLGVEALINTGMMAGLVPITGLSLPLVSYGGSGLVAHGIALGLLVNVALRPGYEVGGEPFRFGPSLSPA